MTPDQNSTSIIRTHDDRIADLLRRNASTKQIAEELQCGRHAVTNRINANPGLKELASKREIDPRATSKYSPELIARIAASLKDGISTSVIAAEVGLTRSALLGLITRRPELRDMPERNRSHAQQKSISVRSSRKQGGIIGGKPGKAILEARQARQNLHAGNIQSKREARQHDPVYREPVVPIGAAEYDSGCPRVSLVDHRESQCRWPLGDIREGTFAYCGHPRSWPSPYCAHHHDRSVQNRFVCAEAA